MAKSHTHTNTQHTFNRFTSTADVWHVIQHS